MKRLLSILTATFLAGCTVSTMPSSDSSQVPAVVQTPGTGRASDSFGTVVSRLEPVAESLCRQRSQSANCDFRIMVDNRRDVPPNAFQTLDQNGRPVIVFTASLLNELQAADEVAFIMGHEAAHHIEGHIPRQQQSTAAGAALAGLLATAAGGNADVIRTAQELGAFAGQRQFSKEHELEADALGTIIAHRAGYDPLTGAAYFSRMADPGDRFMGSHPPNAERLRIVRRTAAELE